MSGSKFRHALGPALFTAGLIFLGLLIGLSTAAAADPNVQAFQRAWQAQNQHTPRLMALPGVVGTALGANAQGQWAVSVYTAHGAVGGIPAKLDGVPVTVEVTGPFFALGPKAKPGTGTTIDPKKWFRRPVPIGVSTGNENECSAGTIGCRVTDGTNVYALSNNHVYAQENNAAVDDIIAQPGLYDTGCVYNPNNFLGNLSGWVTIHFDGTSNTVDAAIALTTTDNLGNATVPPSNGGYGTPSSSPAAAFVGQSVQKYGRTTKLTKGTVSAINATVNIGYTSGTARFVSQIVVVPTKGQFIRAGDSGSLLVTTDGNRPVGLLFAGSSSGYAIANQIADVLGSLKDELGVTLTIDGE